MDQYLFEYYEHDIAEEKITKDAACELLTNLWIKSRSGLRPGREEQRRMGVRDAGVRGT